MDNYEDKDLQALIEQKIANSSNIIEAYKKLPVQFEFIGVSASSSKQVLGEYDSFKNKIDVKGNRKELEQFLKDNPICVEENQILLNVVLPNKDQLSFITSYKNGEVFKKLENSLAETVIGTYFVQLESNLNYENIQKEFKKSMGPK